MVVEYKAHASRFRREGPEAEYVAVTQPSEHARKRSVSEVC